ncbi:MAG: elongation factor Ts [bacterium]|nr:elongation factor Ts [bacterium]
MTTTITTENIRQLRARTGAGIMDVREALQVSEGDEEKAIKFLREKGKIKQAKKADRSAVEGMIGCYVHSNKKLVALVALRCETDFVAMNPVFQELAKDIAMHVAACDPLAVSADAIPAELIAREQEAVEKEVSGLGKPENIAQGIIKGKMDKFKAERALLSQPFVKNPEITVGDLLGQKVGEIGENIFVERFQRMEL